MIFPRKATWKDGQSRPSNSNNGNPYRDLPLSYSWLITGRLAVGPIPKSSQHWKQLENDGFKSSFSCCYHHEHIFIQAPESWQCAIVSLPDHRRQEELTKEKLKEALNQAMDLLMNLDGPLYLHCFAGQERSALLGVGLVCLLEKKDVFSGLSYVKQCHSKAKPLYEHLEILDSLLQEMR